MGPADQIIQGIPGQGESLFQRLSVIGRCDLPGMGAILVKTVIAGMLVLNPVNPLDAPLLEMVEHTVKMALAIGNAMEQIIDKIDRDLKLEWIYGMILG